jgi:hypothetical protein
MSLETVADTRLSDSLTFRVVTDEQRYEDFVGEDDVFFISFVNNTMWTGDKVIPEERYLIVYRYEDEESDRDEDNKGQVVAMFPADSYSHARTL